MKTLFIIPLIIVLSCSLAQKEVYICNNGKTKKYHLSSDCRGLSNCTFKIIKTTLDKAKNEGKTLCGWEK